MVCRGHVELCIPKPETVCRSTSSFHHLRNGIDPEDLAFGSDQGSYAQCWLSGTRSNVQNRVPTANQSILDKSLRDRREHLPDDFAVLLPERRGITPSVYNLLVGLHHQKYTCRVIDAHAEVIHIRLERAYREFGGPPGQHLAWDAKTTA